VQQFHQQTDQREFVYRIDAEGRICFVNPAWQAFAAENGWQVGAAQVLGSELMAFITDARTRHLYGLLIQRVRESGRLARFGYRCDAPDCRRLMEMQMHYDDARQQVEFRSRVALIERREPVVLFDPTIANRTDDIVSVCSWCKAVLADQAWVEVEEAVIRLELFSVDALPRISHGICPDCSERISTTANCA
jgi:hypothetical protein